MQNDSPGKAVTFQIHRFLFFSSSIRSLHRHSQPFLGFCDTEGGKKTGGRECHSNVKRWQEYIQGYSID